MTKLTFGSHPYLLGFDQLERLAGRAARDGTEGYPPFNIEQTGENAFRITVAVAGFSEDDIAITVEDHQLIIRGHKSRADEGRVFLHRGIAARQFQRVFVLADAIEVVGAMMEDGVLHVDLTRSVPEAIVQTVPITRA